MSIKCLVQCVFSGANWEADERRRANGALNEFEITVEPSPTNIAAQTYAGARDQAAREVLTRLDPLDLADLNVVSVRTAALSTEGHSLFTGSYWYREEQLLPAAVPSSIHEHLPLARKCLAAMELHEESFVPADPNVEHDYGAYALSYGEAAKSVARDDLEWYLLSNMLSSHLWNDTYSWALAVTQWRGLQHPDDDRRYAEKYGLDKTEVAVD